MALRWIWTTLAGAGIALALGACAATSDAPPFDPSACYDRDFSIYFEGQDATLTREAREVIDAVASSVRGCSIASVQIIGQADAHEGGQVTSQEISVRRAEVMADYLAQRVGWPRSRFELLATGGRGAVTDEGLVRPLRSRARIVAHIAAP